MEVKSKKCKVVMLPTNTPTGIFIDKSNKLHFSLINKIRNNNEGRHLYITSDDKIKEGDWCLNTRTNQIFKTQYSDKEVKSPDRKKIIATTDLLLNSPTYKQTEGVFSTRLPQPSKAFIEKYCKAGGIDDILVEYEDLINGDINSGRYLLDASKLKVSKDNTITIHPIKDSWSKEELIEVLEQFKRDFDKPKYTTQHCNGKISLNSIFNVREWVENKVI